MRSNLQEPDGWAQSVCVCVCACVRVRACVHACVLFWLQNVEFAIDTSFVILVSIQLWWNVSSYPLDQWFPTGGTRTPTGTQAHCRGYVETFNNHLCYVILFENHQHGGTHGMTNRLRGYTRQKRLGNTALDGDMWSFLAYCNPSPLLLWSLPFTCVWKSSLWGRSVCLWDELGASSNKLPSSAFNHVWFSDKLLFKYTTQSN